MDKILGLRAICRLFLGAEAAVYLVDFFGGKAVMKLRLAKTYRVPELDHRIRSLRTVNEARAMWRATQSGVKVPALLAVSRKGAAILMAYVDGVKLSNVTGDVAEQTSQLVGESIAKLHLGGAVHGDAVPTNMILSGRELFLIDFGLSESGYSIEQRAVDVNLFLRFAKLTWETSYSKIEAGFRDAYLGEMGNTDGSRVMQRVSEIRLRGRYVPERKLHDNNAEVTYVES